MTPSPEHADVSPGPASGATSPAAESASMTPEALCEHLGRGEIVALPLETWTALAPAFVPVESHDTQISGELAILRGPCGLVAVEIPRLSERAVRPLPSLEDAHRFVEQRLATYERMWNGCGCRVDYYR